MITFYAAIWIICRGIEDGSWEWWLKGCWVFPKDVIGEVAVGALIAAAVGLQLWSASRQPKA